MAVNNPFARKRRHLGEHAAEWTIRIVASFSILVIFLIFIFVFREASSLLTSKSEPAEQPTTNVVATTDDRPEIYNPDSGPEPGSVTTTTTVVKDSDKPEVYNPDVTMVGMDEPVVTTTSIVTLDDRPEVYNPDSGPEPGSVIAAAAAPYEAHEQPTLWDNITSNVWQPVGENPKFGVWPLLIGTLKTTLIAILIGAPLGILAALYSAFFAPRKLREVLKPAIELLAGFPSVVIGFFCLTTVASLLQDITGSQFRLNALIGGIGLSLAVIPIVFTIAEDALSAVPKTLREASLALGSTEWQTAYRVMLPAAAPGVFAAVLLGVGRAFGETMIAIMATGNAPLSSWSPATPARTLAATIGSEMGEVVWGSEHYGVLFLLGIFLFVVSFGLNALTELYVKQRLIKKFQGA